MWSKILVPLDGSAEAAVAVPLAAALATAAHAEIVLLRAVDRADEHRDASAYLDQLAASLALSGLTAHTIIAAGHPAGVIVEQAQSCAADLIVINTHGRGGVTRAVLGSVASAVLAHTTLPIVITRSHSRPVEHVNTLLVPLDGTPGSALALASARDVASATGAHLVLVQVVMPLVRYLRGKYIEPQWEEEHRAAAQSYLDSLAAALRRAGYHATGHALIGPVARSIIEEAQRADADLIVMSTHALTGPERAVIGSTADEVVRGADRPVLLVRQAAESTARP